MIYKEERKMEIKTLFKDGTVGYYCYCEVTQIILNDRKTNEYWNYFTHIDFSSSFVEETDRCWLTDKPISINDKFRVMITRQVLPAKSIIDTVDNAVKTQTWQYKDDCAKLDEVFVIAPRYVPETDPTGSIITENSLVPLESSLYGSNINGNYYIVELFSSKRFLESVLTKKDRLKIQDIIRLCHLQYNLDSLTDRMGNIICKLRTEIVVHNSLKLGPENGIIGRFSIGKKVDRPINCLLNILEVDDHTIIENRIVPFELNAEKPCYEYIIEPNRYHNRISVIDQHTGTIYYSSDRDYSLGSDYYSIVKPPQYMCTASEYRLLKIEGQAKRIKTHNLYGIGIVEIEKEIYETVRRQNVWKNNGKANNHYFQSFNKGQVSEAVSAVRDIVNDKTLLWDLKEVWLIDPYLSAKDILNTVVYCEKYGIKIKCLTCLSTMNDNVVTKINIDEDMDKFQESKKLLGSELSTAIPEQSDLQLEFRTVRGHFGEPFHDRYIILKYDINKCRAWSLGISVNALGTSHHIIQIVESPEDVAEVFERIWKDTDNAECLIYTNCKK